jgi:hypothetical protein
MYSVLHLVIKQIIFLWGRCSSLGPLCLTFSLGFSITICVTTANVTTTFSARRSVKGLLHGFCDLMSAVPPWILPLLVLLLRFHGIEAFVQFRHLTKPMSKQDEDEELNC